MATLESVTEAYPNCEDCQAKVVAAKGLLDILNAQLSEEKSHLNIMESSSNHVNQEIFRAPCKEAVLTDISSAIISVNGFQTALVQNNPSQDEIKSFIADLKDKINQLKEDTTNSNLLCADRSDCPLLVKAAQELGEEPTQELGVEPAKVEISVDANPTSETPLVVTSRVLETPTMNLDEIHPVCSSQIASVTVISKVKSTIALQNEAFELIKKVFFSQIF